jgi:mannose-6-phosphate isomerase-like protein (cupin superfamily)
MSYKLTKATDIFEVEKFGMKLDVLPDIGDVGVVVAETQTGHNQEFYHKTSTFHYFLLEGEGSFFLNDEEVSVKKGDMLSVPPGTRIYYKGTMRILLVTNPPWTEEGEVETKTSIW